MNKQSEERYPFTAVEQKWRPAWKENELYKTGDDPHKPDIYVLDYFPYPSGAGLSVGHARNYVPTCVASRYYRMRGYNVLHPMGWDAFGLPAENYAIRHHIPPSESTRIFTDTYRRQMQLLECSYDWSREINSTDPHYYRWTQWFFLLLHERGLAYQAIGSQWWCPDCQTILANEQVENGRCWRCDAPVEKKDLQQWYFKITDYADRLIADLDTINWPEPIKQMQRNWIGRSQGAELIFTVGDAQIPVFTTRPDTLFGVTFLALAPEHPLVDTIAGDKQAAAVSSYVALAQRKNDIDRTAADREKSGVFTGAFAAHPLTGRPVPIWVADYVLPGVGSGAVMGVPGHDERDFAFARRYGLPVIHVVAPEDGPHDPDACFTEPGIVINSGSYSGLPSAVAAAQITAGLAQRGLGGPQVTYRLRDWLISRQRYWGAPIPVIHCPACGAVPVPKEQLPVTLPEMDDFAPAGDGRSPLARVADWVHTTCPACGGPAQRETDTMDGFACSSWYFLRFASPHEAERPFDPEAVRRWLPVDLYVGGAEHAVMHLLYARFWTKVMFDAGLVDFTEPFSELRNQGMLLSPMDGHKMSKSRNNVITPDEVIERVGTDALRAYVLFLGPFDQNVTWDDAGVKGVTRFLDRFWRLAQETVNPKEERNKETEENEAFERARHRLIKRITADMEAFRFNTAVAALMEYQNNLIAAYEAGVHPEQWRRALETFAMLLAPICPFIAEEVWQTALGHAESVHRQPWPVYDEALTQEEMVTVVVQVNGKVRDRLVMPADVDEETMRKTAVASEAVQRAANGRAVQQVIVVRGRLVNVVTGK